jgi:hypothetical protein
MEGGSGCAVGAAGDERELLARGAGGMLHIAASERGQR